MRSYPEYLQSRVDSLQYTVHGQRAVICLLILVIVCLYLAAVYK
jgi:hypothetical protein